MIFHHFRSYSVTLVPSFEPPFPPVPRASVVIHVVKNASRSKEQEAFVADYGAIGFGKGELQGSDFSDIFIFELEDRHLHT